MNEVNFTLQRFDDTGSATVEKPKGYWKDNDNFIRESKSVHGNKFIYEDVDVSESPTIKGIICRKHGKFDCNLNNHLKGKGGCKKCQYENISDLFTKRNLPESMSDLGDGQVFLNSIKGKIQILCTTHEKVYEVSRVKNVKGCSLCKQEKRIIKSLRYFHKEVYSCLDKEIYDLTLDYKNECAILYCKKHDIYEKITRNLFASFKKRVKKCKLCLKEDIRKRLSFTKEDFIKKSISRYGDQFSYDKLKYVNQNLPITLVCKDHGEFSTYPNNHLRGIVGGCSECEKISNKVSCWKGKHKALRGGYAEKDTYFYVIKITPLNSKEHFFKIGLSRTGVKQRYSGKKYKDKFTYNILMESRIYEFKGVMLECFLLEEFKKHKVLPTCKFEGYTECFKTLTDYMILIIERYTNEQLQK